MTDNKSTNGIDINDFSLDDLEDLPSFKSFPSGSYVVTLEKGLETKKVGDHPAIEAVMSLISIEEVTGEFIEGKPPAVGDKCSTLFMMDNEMGRGKFKEFAAPIAEMCGSKAIKDIINVSKGLKMVIIGKATPKKDEPDKIFFNVVKMGIIL